jgi:deoxyribose-phosphate aldolase
VINIKIETILSKCDHTLLTQTATWPEIKNLCDEAIEYKTASVCIPPCYVKTAKDYISGKTKICTVIGFPNGNTTTETKLFEAADALNKGADEIDMVINIGMLKAKNCEYVSDEIKRIKELCGNRILKVIIETCLLTEDEKIKMCEIINNAGADYIKTSTGFSSGGATFKDIKLFKKYLSPDVKIKAAGGISSLEDAEKFIRFGVKRLGTSKIVKIAKQETVIEKGLDIVKKRSIAESKKYDEIGLYWRLLGIYDREGEDAMFKYAREVKFTS